MRDAFEPEQLQSIIECLEGSGYRCEVLSDFDQIPAALSSPRTQLLLTGTCDSDLSPLLKPLNENSRSHAPTPVLVYLDKPVTGQGEEWLLHNVSDFIMKPLNLTALLLRIRRLECHPPEGLSELEQTKNRLVYHFGMRQFVGESASFLVVINQIPRVASCNVTVMLMGDTGTGKEMCARAIHYTSERANRPFVPINCGSIPTELFENELFGHDHGAFTDARRAQRGLIAEAEGGTLFLDEVNSLAPLAQIKLLRFLQDQQYKPLGSTQSRQANVRVIAASNQDLQQLVRERRFREDLYYRLNVVLLRMPALRERREDILLLASHFLQNAASEYNRPPKRFSRDAAQKLLSYSWPGNVRELENAVRQAVILCDDEVIRAYQLQLSPNSAPTLALAKESFKAAKTRTIKTFEREYLENILAACGGNISKAAREAKKDRRSFFALLKKYSINTYAAPAASEQSVE